MSTRVVVRDNRDLTWRSVEPGELTAATTYRLLMCGIAVVGSLTFIDRDDLTTAHIELAEDNELIVCGECGCLEPKQHPCVEPAR